LDYDEPYGIDNAYRYAYDQCMTAQEMGHKGGKARAAKMTTKQLSASAKKAAVARWSKRKPK
jgi:hypothetical protein